METEVFILEVTRLMIPVLTGFLVIVASAIGRIWTAKADISRWDYVGVTTISFCGLLSFGCWAGALAGAMIYTTGKSGSILFKTLTSDQNLVAAQNYVGHAYSLFVITVIASGIYYLFLLRTANREAGPVRKSRN